MNDLRFAVRMLFKAPVHSAIAVATIALGVGLTTHTFSIVHGSAIRGLPYDGADRLMAISEDQPAEGVSQRQVTVHDFTEFRRQQTTFDDLGAYYMGTVNLADDDRSPERVLGAFVTANVFEQVGVRPILGRSFAPGEDSPNGPQTLILSWDVWQNRYGADPGIIGRTVRANGVSHTVIGIMPQGFKFPFDNYIWLPHGLDPAQLERGQGRRSVMVGRLAEGVTRSQAEAEFQAISARLETEYPGTNRGVVATMTPFTERYMPKQILAVLWAMLFSVFGVLLIACFNVANLLLARAADRTREVAIRSALGGSRGAIVRQLLVESTLLAVIGGALGVALASVGIDLYAAAVQDIQKPFWLVMELNRQAVIFAIVITLAASLISGVAPALKASGTNVGEVLKNQSKGSSSLSMNRFSSALVVGEIALSCALLVGAGLMVKSVVKIKALDMGFATENVLTARVGLAEADYPDEASLLQFDDQLLERLRGLPGVTAAALTSNLPGAGSYQTYFAVDGRVYEDELQYPGTNYAVVTPDFFTTFGTTIVSGRGFTEQDGAANLPVVIVNQSFVTRHLGTDDPLGERIRMGRTESTGPWLTVVGVVPDLHIGGGVGGIGSDQTSPDQIYLPLAQHPQRFASLAVKTPGDPLASAPALRAAVASLDPNLPIYDVDSMDGVIETNTWAFTLFGSLFSIFGLMALFMAAIGLYGVMAFSVRRRTQEMGIRIALGARHVDVFRLVLGKGLRQLGVGIAVGLAMGAALAGPLRFVLFDVDTSDWTVYAAIVLTLLVTGVAATAFPARRATRVDLIEALRPE